MTNKERIGNFISLYELRNSEKKDYPVVGITWDQANAFCAWRTNFLMKG